MQEPSAPDPGATVDGDLCLATIAGLYNDLTVALDCGRSVSIDMGTAETADLSVLQLIVAARRQAETRGGSVTLATAAPPALAALLERAGFAAAAGTADHDFWFQGERHQ